MAAAPKDVAAWQQLAAAYVQQTIRTGDPAFSALAERALTNADDAMLATGAPDSAPLASLIGRASLAMTRHEFSRGLEYATRALAIRPDDPGALALLDEANVELGHYDEAEDTLQRLLDRRPGAAALARVSYLRELHGDSEGAAAAMVQAAAAAADPFDRATIEALSGDLAFNRGDLAAATAHYGTASELAPLLPAAAVGRARVLAAEQKTGEAIALLQRTADRFPSPAVVSLLGDVQMLAGRDVDASRSYQLVRATEQLFTAAGSVVDLELSIFEADHGNPERALDLARKAYTARRTIFTADALGWALTVSGRAKEALPYVEESLRLGTRSADFHHHASLAYGQAGDAARAATESRAALEINPYHRSTRPSSGSTGGLGRKDAV